MVKILLRSRFMNTAVVIYFPVGIRRSLYLFDQHKTTTILTISISCVGMHLKGKKRVAEGDFRTTAPVEIIISQ